jgi:hypothetical protein
MDFSEATHSGRTPYSVRSPQGFTPAPAITADSLFDLILKFNLFPALYVHPSWIQSLSAFQYPDSSNQELNPYWIRYLSKTLLDMYQLDQQWEFDFSNPVKKLVLIDADSLMKLGHYAAAILAQPHLRKIISGSKISLINQSIGSENREFSLRWKPLQNNSMLLDLTSLKVLTELANTAMTTKDAWRHFATRLIISCLPHDAVSLRNRLIFKFPIDCRNIDLFQLTKDKRALVAALFFDVVQQQFPDWQRRLELTGAQYAATNVN